MQFVKVGGSFVNFKHENPHFCSRHLEFGGHIENVLKNLVFQALTVLVEI